MENYISRKTEYSVSLVLQGKQLRDILVDNEKLEAIVKQNQILALNVKTLQAEKLERTIKINRVMAEVDALSR